MLCPVAFDVHERHLNAQALVTLRRTLLVVAPPVGTIVAAKGVPWLGNRKLMSQTQLTKFIWQDKHSNKIGEKCRDAFHIHLPSAMAFRYQRSRVIRENWQHHPWHPHLHICLLRIRETTWPHTQDTIGVAVGDAVHENRNWQHRGASTGWSQQARGRVPFSRASSSLNGTVAESRNPVASTSCLGIIGTSCTVRVRSCLLWLSTGSKWCSCLPFACPRHMSKCLWLFSLRRPKRKAKRGTSP